MSQDAQLTDRIPNPDCPACQSQTRHSPEEWARFHPDAGTGYMQEYSRAKNRQELIR